MHHKASPTLSPTKRARLVRAINSASKPVGGAHRGKTPKRLGPTLGHLQLIYLDCSSNKPLSSSISSNKTQTKVRFKCEQGTHHKFFSCWFFVCLNVARFNNQHGGRRHLPQPPTASHHSSCIRSAGHQSNRFLHRRNHR